jgi:DNA-directed RNA polymerase subunit M/transcription elongation factor TFIIS
MISSFMGLAEVFNGFNDKFFVSRRKEMEVENVNLLVQQMAYKLVKRHCGRELQFKTLSEIAYIYQKSLPVERELDPGPEIPDNKKRKTSTQLGPRQRSNCGNDTVNYVIDHLCVKDEEATPYIIAALKESRILTSLDTLSRRIFGVTCRNESDSV